MVGIGSGAYGLRGSKTRKRTIEETYSLDIQDLKNNLNNKVLSYSWDNGTQSISILTKTNYIVLAYSAGGEKIETRVNIDSTKVGYGSRLWFNCPACKKRTARLYIAGKYFRCRDCHQLTYLTCQESGDPLDYLSLKIRRLQKRLGLDGKDIHVLPYFKPKHMHWETFSTLRLQLEIIQMHRMKAWLEVCSRF